MYMIQLSFVRKYTSIIWTTISFFKENMRVIYEPVFPDCLYMKKQEMHQYMLSTAKLSFE